MALDFTVKDVIHKVTNKLKREVDALYETWL
jgi:hypothetical protein